MDIKTFKVERWMNDFEDHCTYNLAETCIDSLTVKELIELSGENVADYMAKLAGTRLTYSHIFGSPELLEGIAGLYKDLAPDEILPMHGAVGSNYQAITTAVDPGDNVVSIVPTYQQHYSIPESFGAEVRILKLDIKNHFKPDIDELKKLVDNKTKMITFSSPNNPTGSLITKEEMERIIEIAKKVDAYILSDETYRGISEDGSYMFSVADLYEKGVSVGSMSKCYSLAGLRLGWIATKDKDLMHRLRERRDYNTISCGVIDDKLASLALKHKDKILARNSKILLGNRKILDDWVKATPEVYYEKPVAGTTALVYYKKDMPSSELCQKLLKSKGVLFTPGECFEMEGSVRIGYAFDSKLLKQGLDLFAEFLREI